VPQPNLEQFTASYSTVQQAGNDYNKKKRGKEKKEEEKNLD
jgi:hypothetical protein